MTLGQIYALAVEMGKKADPRTEAGVKKYLARKKTEFDELPKSKKEDYDPEDLKNPYADSRVLLGGPDLNVDKILAGIDITSGEVVLADALNRKQKKSIDLLLSHHPVGAPYAALHEVMDLQADLMAKYGVPINVAEGLMHDRISEVERLFSPRNHNQAVDAARLLGFAIMCTHTITDNLVYDFLEKLFERKSPETVGDIVKILKEVPEYKEAAKGKAGPIIFCGSPGNRAGKVAPIEITGGTESSSAVYEKLAIAGVGTIIGMHAGEDHRKECMKHHMNMVVAGHMSSDSLGMNLFLDELEKRGVEIVACSGLIRVKRF